MNRLISFEVIIIITICCSLLTFCLGWSVLAGTVDVGLNYGQQTGLGTNDIRITVANITKTVLGVLGIIAVLLILYAGMKYLSSNGDPEKIDTVRKILISATIGLVIILSAYALTNFILSKLLEATGVEMGGVNVNTNQNTNQENINQPGGETGGETGGLPVDEEDGNTVDNFVLNYNGQQTALDSFDFSQPVTTFYDYSVAATHIDNLEDYGGVFENMLQTNRDVTFIYTDTSDPDIKKYYLIDIHGKYLGTTGGGTYSGSITGLSAPGCEFIDDPNEPCLKEGETIDYSNRWLRSRTDGEIFYLGDDQSDISFTMTINSFVLNDGLIPEWWFFSPENKDGVLVSTEFPASITINLEATQ